MKISISTSGTTAAPASDLGFLLMKHPDRLHAFPQAFGQAHVLFPVSSEERCTATLLLEVDPVKITKNTGDNRAISLYDYVNDRPYVPSSLIVTVIQDAFRSALKGQCKARPDLVSKALALEVKLEMLRCNAGEGFIRRLFEPLGYEVSIDEPQLLDEQFAEWGSAKHFNVTIARECTVRELLMQLCVLITALDNDKHYEIRKDEIDRLFKLGEGWLVGHPANEVIARRFLGYTYPHDQNALRRLKALAAGMAAEVDDEIPEGTVEAAEDADTVAGEVVLDAAAGGVETVATGGGGEHAVALETTEQAPAEAAKPKLHQQRFNAVIDELKRVGARTIIDLGCGDGKLLRQFPFHPEFEKVVGFEVAAQPLMVARKRVRRLKEDQQERISVEQGSLVYRDDRMVGFDAAICVEVIEHMELSSLAKFTACVFGHARPKFVVITTPNREYNAKYELGEKKRHNDHRFEWTRAEFQTWCHNVGWRFGYEARFAGIGDADEQLGSTTQMATFERVGEAPNLVAETTLLDIGPLLTTRDFATRLVPHMFVKKGEAEASIETLSRFGADPRWLTYLPPTMSPPDRGSRPGLLEHPEQVFDHYRQRGVSTLVAEEKHMGSRAIVIVCIDEEVARKRFGVTDGSIGTCYTRTGRAFFHDAETEYQFVARMQRTLSRAHFWTHHATDWVMLDCEVMPWSAKAQGLLTKQYAPVAVAGINSLQSAIVDLEQASRRGLDVQAQMEQHQLRLQAVLKYRDAYRRYCWPVQSLDDYKVAPFHILATEGGVHARETHLWHMAHIAQVAANSDDGLIMATPHRQVDLNNAESCEAASRWWTDLTEAGGEGVVFKPPHFVSYVEGEVLQPAMKCRGREYLRIIYGPEYTLEGNLERLRVRDVRRKRKLAINEFALGLEALERFTRGEPLQRVHECIFGLVALESEPLDPRL